jgi:hypothetical protein
MKYYIIKHTMDRYNQSKQEVVAKTRSRAYGLKKLRKLNQTKSNPKTKYTIKEKP